jgi:hypothetical protein
MKPQKDQLTESDRFLRQALVGLLELKLRSGTAVAELRALTEQCTNLAAEGAGQDGKQQGLDIHRLGSVLRAWHKETQYLAPNGRPSPLSLSGKGSLHQLIGTYYPQAKVAAALAALKKAGLIRRHGKYRWLPTEAHARISADSQETLDHVSEGVSRFLETVLNNVNSNSKADLLFEQSCKVRRLPTSKAAAFKVFVHQQAIAFLTSVDDWLEARIERTTVARSTSKTCSAGVFTFAYLDSPKRAREPRRRRNEA